MPVSEKQIRNINRFIMNASQNRKASVYLNHEQHTDDSGNRQFIKACIRAKLKPPDRKVKTMAAESDITLGDIAPHASDPLARTQ